MSTVSPFVGALPTIGFARLLLRIATGGSRRPVSAVRARRIWPAAVSALLTVFTVQVLLEGGPAAGHPAGLTGVFADGGWLAIGLCIALDGVVELAMGVASRLGTGAQGICAPRWQATISQVAGIAVREARVQRRLPAEHLAAPRPARARGLAFRLGVKGEVAQVIAPRLVIAVFARIGLRRAGWVPVSSAG